MTYNELVPVAKAINNGVDCPSSHRKNKTTLMAFIEEKRLMFPADAPEAPADEAEIDDSVSVHTEAEAEEEAEEEFDSAEGRIARLEREADENTVAYNQQNDQLVEALAKIDRLEAELVRTRAERDHLIIAHGLDRRNAPVHAPEAKGVVAGGGKAKPLPKKKTSEIDLETVMAEGETVYCSPAVLTGVERPTVEAIWHKGDKKIGHKNCSYWLTYTLGGVEHESPSPQHFTVKVGEWIKERGWSDRVAPLTAGVALCEVIRNGKKLKMDRL
jgi:hypothetical protein